MAAAAREGLRFTLAVGIIVPLLLSAAASGAWAEEEAQRLTVTEIRLPKLRHTRPEIVLEALYSEVGGPYGGENAAQDLERLDRLGVFSAVSVRTSKEAGGVALELGLRETTPWLPLITADITDEDGLTVGPGVKAINLFGRGVFLSAAARFGQATTVELKSSNPWIDGGNWIYSLAAAYRDRFNELDEFREHSLDSELKLGRTIGRFLRGGLRFGYQIMESDVDGVTLSPDNRDAIPSIGLFAGFDSRDFWSHTRRGWWSEVEVNRNGGPLGGDGDWWSVVLDVRRYQPLPAGPTLLLAGYTTLQFGTVGVDIPEHRNFHIGGTNSVRGWSLGSTQGRNEMIGTAECRWTVREKKIVSLYGLTAHLGVELAVFGDLGVAWDQGERPRDNDFLPGVGAGVRLLVPFVKSIRFDVAWGERGAHASLHIGAFEKVEKQRERVR